MAVIRLSDVANDDRANTKVAGFTASANIADTQSASSGGIDLELEVRFEGAGDVTIHNPLHFIQYTLRERDGGRLFNGGKPPIPLINRKGPIDEAADFNFAIKEVKKNGRELNVKEQVNASMVLFQKGDRLSHSLQISKYAETSTGNTREIPEGRYQMELIVSVIEADSTPDSVSSRTLKAQDIAISLAR